MIEGQGPAVFDRDSGGARAAKAVRPTSVPLPAEVPTDRQPQLLATMLTTQGVGLIRRWGVPRLAARPVLADGPPI